MTPSPPAETHAPEDGASALRRAAGVLKTVAHPVRLRVIELLSGGERTVTWLYQALGARQDAMSRHLTLLRDRGVLTSRRDGPQVFYALANPDLVKIIQCVRAHCRADFDAPGNGGERLPRPKDPQTV